MTGATTTIEARTKEDLEKKVKQWIAEAKRNDLRIRQGWDPRRVVKTENGYKITVWAHAKFKV